MPLCVDCGTSPEVIPPARVCGECQRANLAVSIMVYTGREFNLAPRRSCFCDDPRLPECVACDRPFAHAAVIELFSPQPLTQGALL